MNRRHLERVLPIYIRHYNEQHPHLVVEEDTEKANAVITLAAAAADYPVKGDVAGVE